MNAGSLRHRIDLLRPDRTDDAGTGETTTAYVPGYAGVPASVWPKGAAADRENAAQTLGIVTYEIRLRFLPGVGSDWRVVVAGKTLEIVSCVDPDNLHSELRIVAVEQTGATPNA